ncbi:isopenicillin N synthase family oxygenase [Gordonia sp. HY442]|uniref:isopenicillin N synthase family dioxygenase n=1 Tax=Gordonia zhenghanii TaxID=2911516 RepID=UPI001F201319|nr:2-oxoglutarate and iron-dependent oxygenase domain-containing protein [Gordonia zhenghanii]MCF8605816.1 isopenicillin N synthase family oxygenase [Gordonia zhenghanii]
MRNTALPVVDMSLLDGDADDLAEFRTRLLDATHRVGFFYLVGHGVSDDEIDRMFAVSRDFFALDDAAKRDVEMTKSPHFRGYTRFGGEYTQGQIDWREQIDVAAEYPPLDGDDDFLLLDGPNLWPAALPELKTAVVDWQERCRAIGLRLMREWACALGAPRDVFDSGFAQRPSTLLKLVKYPGRDSADKQGVGAHKDPGVLTLLMIEPGKEGLQVLRETWIDVPPMPQAFVVNIGELMEWATDGYLTATMHRVVSPPAGQTRLSIPFFFNPALTSSMAHLDLPDDLRSAARGVTDDPDNPISATFGENMLKARLRAHPDVARIHHPHLV